MDINQIDKDKAVSWSYLPDIATLLQYLNRIDLIELSKCCKRYRCQLESQVLEKLDLYSWSENNSETYNELRESNRLGDTLEFLKTDLGDKLKLVKKFTLDCEIDYCFAQIFVRLLPNIKSLSLCGSDDYDSCSGEGSVAILKGMKYLEHVLLCDIYDKVNASSDTKQIFPKSLKSLKINNYFNLICVEDELAFYNTIDTSYINLWSLTIASNRMLQNLSSGMPSLQEVYIDQIDNLDMSKLVAFLKCNPQLRKLKTNFNHYNEEIFKTIISYQYLEYWSVRSDYWENLGANSLSSNYSIKYLKISYDMPSPLTLQLINACNNLETLDFEDSGEFKCLDWSKLKRKIKFLNLSRCFLALKMFSKIDSSKLFKKINLEHNYDSNKIFYDKYSISKLNNYKYIPLISNACILKLIN